MRHSIITPRTLLPAAVAMSAALMLAPAFGATATLRAQVLTFEGIASAANPVVPIGNYYNGGAGPNYGVQFSDNALALCLNTATVSCSNTSRGGQGNANSQGGAMYFQAGTNAYMNRAAGFMTGFSFFYTDVTGAGSFDVWSGLNGTGTLLATLALPETTTGSGCFGAAFCPFIPAGISFAGVAQSVTFEGTNALVLDDITIGSATAGVVTTPEPGTWALLGTGLLAVGGVVMRRRRTA